MEINKLYFSQSDNHSDRSSKGFKQTGFSGGELEKFNGHVVNHITNNNNEKVNECKTLVQQKQQQEDRVLFRFVPKHVIDALEPLTTIQLVARDCDSLTLSYLQPPSAEKIRTAVNENVVQSPDSGTSSLSQHSLLQDEFCGNSLNPTTSTEETSPVLNAERTKVDTLARETSSVSESKVSAENLVSESPTETSGELQSSASVNEAPRKEKEDASSLMGSSVQPHTGTFCEEDKEFEFLKVTPVRRSSSLKSSVSSSSLCKKKEVRFADVLGLDLESVRHISSTSEPPVVPRKALKDLRFEKSDEWFRPQMKQILQLCPCFSQPGYAGDFAKRVLERRVMLETLTVDDLNVSVTGSVCVVNFVYVKRVFVRYTTNGWLTYNDVGASYFGASNGGRIDKFMFKIKLPASFGFGSRLEFAVCYESMGQVYWDNNLKTNYRVECYYKQVAN